MNMIDYVILGIIFSIMAVIIYKKIKYRKSGGCCGCSGCQMKEQCKKKR